MSTMIYGIIGISIAKKMNGQKMLKFPKMLKS